MLVEEEVTDSRPSSGVHKARQKRAGDFTQDGSVGNNEQINMESKQPYMLHNPCDQP
jgi:hypothetical protein